MHQKWSQDIQNSIFYMGEPPPPPPPRLPFYLYCYHTLVTSITLICLYLRLQAIRSFRGEWRGAFPPLKYQQLIKFSFKVNQFPLLILVLGHRLFTTLWTFIAVTFEHSSSLRLPWSRPFALQCKLPGVVWLALERCSACSRHNYQMLWVT